MNPKGCALGSTANLERFHVVKKLLILISQPWIPIRDHKCETRVVPLALLRSQGCASGSTVYPEKFHVVKRMLIFLSQAWNPASEDQCFDRCHRLGQTEEVKIYKV